ncbi:MAG: hypothetical protein KGS48_12925 [Bacteroidetes bacterium]|nr:hypothetical protein [Bacteroidota bacterium]
MRFMLFPLAWMAMAFMPGQPQFSVSQTIHTVASNMDGITMGVSEKEVLANKPQITAIDRSRGFRIEAVDSINQSGLNNITYFFDADGNAPLYEFILEFSDDRVRRDAAFEMLGPSNYPGESDQWILSMNEKVLTIAWAYDNKLVVASNLPGSEWEGSDMFKLPENQKMYAHLSFPTSWPLEEQARFFGSLGKQIDAHGDEFHSIKGKSLETNPAYRRCLAPLSVAKSASLFQGDNGKWWICNNLVDGLDPDYAANWALELGGLFKEYLPDDYSLEPGNAQKVIGLNAETWHVLDENKLKTGLKLAVVCYPWGDEGLWNVDLLVMQE